MEGEVVYVYALASPTYPHMGRTGFRSLLDRIAVVDPTVVHGPFNARGAWMKTTRHAARNRADPELAASSDRLADTDDGVRRRSLTQMR